VLKFFCDVRGGRGPHWPPLVPPLIVLCGVRSEEQLADIFTKPLDENTFSRLRSELNVLDASNIM
jgi:hypothetical protein